MKFRVDTIPTIPESKYDYYYQYFRALVKGLKVLDKLGIKWIPYRCQYTGTYDKYYMQVVLPDHNALIEIRYTLPRYGKVRFTEAEIVHEDKDGNRNINHFGSMTMLFMVLENRFKRGDALVQDTDYIRKHGEYLARVAQYRKWLKNHNME